VFVKKNLAEAHVLPDWLQTECRTVTRPLSQEFWLLPARSISER
jgi:hypothetical protein